MGVCRTVVKGLQYISMAVRLNIGIMFLVTSVYASMDMVVRRELWDYLVGLSCNVTMPWPIMVDYNTILDS